VFNTHNACKKFLKLPKAGLEIRSGNESQGIEKSTQANQESDQFARNLISCILGSVYNVNVNFAWYLDITPNKMFSLYNYPIPGKDGLPLCELHGKQLEMKEVVVYDEEATSIASPDNCWICKS